MFTPQLIPN